MNEILSINNVHGYLDKETGIAFLNAEDVARGFGFTQIAKSGNVVVRWERVNRYLCEFGFIPTCGDGVKAGDYIPENMVYRLGFKANNEVAQRFQAVLADEVLPSIRKHGAYMTEETLEKALLNPDGLIKILTALKNEQAKTKALRAETTKQKQLIGELKPKADYTDKILASKGTVPITVIAKDYGMSGRAMNKVLADLKIIYQMAGQWLLYSRYQAKGYTHSESFAFNHADGRLDVKMTTKWTQKGRLFLYQKLKKHGILPMIEQ
ncbi:phage antirepressor [Acidaminococcus fermentans]|uniref:phage antirepressor n=1 Tax=Acidaminococcus fermentans TaxID=905 RepID=UPI00242CFB1A|nr:phage antirepressor KilAC domain-containing protein [Acidaminococcus fermentans]